MTPLLCFRFILLLIAEANISLKRINRPNGHDKHMLIRNLLNSNKSISTAHVVEMTNFFNKMYTGSISIGTPSQQFTNVVFDIGSADLWVLSINSNINEEYLHYYSSFDSTTYQSVAPNDWQIAYKYGYLQGDVGKDTIIIGNLTANNQVFAEATYTDISMTKNYPQEGICGFARKEASTMQSEGTTLIQTLINNNQNPSGLFAFYLTGHSDNGSALIFGDSVWNLNYYHSDSMQSFNVSDDIDYPIGGLWSMSFDEITIDNKYKITQKIDVIFDTGTAYIGVAEKEYSNFMKEITHNRTDCILNSTDNLYFCKNINKGINNLPMISFIATNSNGKQITLDLDAISYLDDDNKLSFMPLKGLNIWIMGDTFLIKYYSIYDYKQNQIHLALSKYNKTYNYTSKMFTTPSISPTKAPITQKPVNNDTNKISPTKAPITQKHVNNDTNKISVLELCLIIGGGVIVLLLVVVSSILCIKYKRSDKNQSEVHIQLDDHLVQQTDD